MDLRTDYADDILDTSVNEKRKYRFTTNSDGTTSLTDETVYTQEGDYFGAVDVNTTNKRVNDIYHGWLLGGYENTKTVFNADGSITETNNSTGHTEVTTFNADGSITQKKYDSDGDLTATMNTIFNSDGSITTECEYQ